MEWFIGLACAALRLGFLLTHLGGIEPPRSIRNTFTTKIAEAAALNS